jgi:thymidine kinase
MNWKGEPFPVFSRLKEVADRIVMLKARCAICNEPAIYTYKKGGSGATVELGAGDIYEPRCARHYPFSLVYEGENAVIPDEAQQVFPF